ncbi:MAG: segregation/condensation protein A [Erysipelotrichaceae bacterium]
MSFTVNTTHFEGPLDLMLHLIKEQELDLFDLDINILTDQYLKYLNAMENLHLEVESEYLVELATLIEYKSKKLLPKQEVILDSEYEEDPSQLLAQRLIMYQKFKDVAGELEASYHARQQQVSKPMSILVDDLANEQQEFQAISGSPYDLMKAMNKVLRRLQLSKPVEVKFAQKEISVDDRITQIKARLIDLPKTFSFDQLIEDCENVHVAIVTFLSILELAKRHFLYFSVDEKETIWFTRGNHES